MTQEQLNDLKEDLNKILIKMSGLKTLNEVNTESGLNYSDDTTIRTPHKDPAKAQDRDWDDIQTDYNKIRLINLKTAISDILNDRHTLINWFDKYKMSGY